MAKNGRWVGERVLDSLAGLRAGWQREAALRMHYALAAVGILLVAIVRPPAIWTIAFLILLIVSAAVELLNGALEAVIDRVHPGRDPEIGAAKDMASAAAFLLNVSAAAAGIAAIWAGLAD